MTFVAQTGSPFTVNSSITTAQGATSHPIMIRNPYQGGGSPDPSRTDITSCPTSVHNTTNWYNPCAFVNPPPATAIAANAVITGQAALAYLGGTRNTVYGPGYNRVNGSLFKNFGLFREIQLQLRADYFNLLNTPAYGSPLVSGQSYGSVGSTGGQITSTRSLGQFYPDSRFFNSPPKSTSNATAVSYLSGALAGSGYSFEATDPHAPVPANKGSPGHCGSAGPRPFCPQV